MFNVSGDLGVFLRAVVKSAIVLSYSLFILFLWIEGPAKNYLIASSMVSFLAAIISAVVSSSPSAHAGGIRMVSSRATIKINFIINL